MLRVSRIMTRDVITVSPELGLRDVMELFAKRHVSGAPVVAERKVLGVVTLSDIVTLAASLPGSPTMRAEPREPGEEEMEAEEYEEGDEGTSAFFTDMWDDAGADASERASTVEGPEWSALDECTVRDAMTTDVLSLPSDASVEKAAEFMQEHKVHRVLIMEDGELLGIVTTSDIARAVAEHKISGRRYVFGMPERRGDGSWW